MTLDCHPLLDFTFRLAYCAYPQELGKFAERARLVCAAVPRREVISGWDLLDWRPKDAERVVPAGSAYSFEDPRGRSTSLPKGWPAVCGSIIRIINGEPRAITSPGSRTGQD